MKKIHQFIVFLLFAIGMSLVLYPVFYNYQHPSLTPMEIFLKHFTTTALGTIIMLLGLHYAEVNKLNL